MIPLYYKKKDKVFEINGKETDIDKISYGLILTKEGLFSVLNTNGYSIIRPAEKELEQFDSIKESTFYTYPTISFELYTMALKFLRQVYKEHKSEGALLLILNRTKPLSEQKYKIYIPKQTVSSASVDYSIDYKELEKDEFLAGSIHSHPDFDAFQSGVDHEDEFTFDGVHLTFGHIDKTIPDIHGRIVLGGKSYDAENLIEISPETKIEIPEDWLKKVEKPSYSVRGYLTGYDDNAWPYEQNNWRNYQHQPNIFNMSLKDLINSMKPIDVVNQKNTYKLQSII